MKRRAGHWTVVLIALISAGCATTYPQHKLSQAVRESASAELPTRLLLLRPDVHVYELSAGGVRDEVGAWTEQATANILAALSSHRGALQRLDFHQAPPLEEADTETVRQHLALHDVVGGSAILVTQAAQLSAWQHKNLEFDYSLGPGLAFLAERTGLDAAVVINAEDVVSSGGRVATFILAAAFGVAIPMGHSVVVVSVVDLRTGDLLWMNYAAVAASTDLREPQDAAKLIEDVFDDYPGLDAWRKLVTASAH